MKSGVPRGLAAEVGPGNSPVSRPRLTSPASDVGNVANLSDSCSSRMTDGHMFRSENTSDARVKQAGREVGKEGGTDAYMGGGN